MASFNKVILMGNLTRDPELKTLPSGTNLVDITIAVNRVYKDSQGAQQEEVSFIDGTAFGRRAEVINQYFNKGKPILIEGRLRQDKWQDQNGNNRSKIKVTVENFSFVGGSSGQDSGGQPGGAQPQGSSAPAPNSAPPDSIPEDDIPF